MKNKFLLALASMVLCLTVASYADIIKLENTNGDIWKTITLDGTSGSAATGLYTLYDTTTKQTWQSFCIDPLGAIQPGDEWTADLKTGSAVTSGALSASTYGTSATITEQKYAMINYLAQTYYYNGTLDASGQSDLSLALWEIARDYNNNDFTTLNLGSGKFQATEDALTSTMLTNAFNARNTAITMSVFSPTGKPSQEFLYKVPEPGLFSFMGLTLLSILGLVSYRRKK